ncbi:MAG: hypothetical protein IJJ06_09370 [Mogibacterium sp.]|nr:hypothetical protein [Mogibacterium sp.]
MDGRTLTEKPLIVNEGYPTGMETYLRDRLGMADQIKVAYASLNDALADELINTAYQNGKEGWTFFKIHNNLEYSDYHKAFADYVLNMQKYCEARGSKFYYVFNPEKESVYRSYLPAGVNYDDSWVDHMLAYMQQIGINCIDLRSILAEKSSEEDVFNKKYDAGHWNNTGAFYGMKALTEHIHADNPSVKVLDKEEYYITTTIAEKMYGSNQKINEDVPSYTLKSEYTDVTGVLASEISMSETYPHIAIYTNDSKEASAVSRMLVLHDDLYGQFSLSRAKETVEMSCFQNALNLDYYYNIFRPEVVVFETMEYVISDGYFSSDSMASKTWQPAAIKNYPSSSFDTRKDDLLAGVEEADFDVDIMLDPGKTIDRVHLSKLIDRGKYFYLINDSGVIDLQTDSNGVASASVRHNEFKPGKTATLYYVAKNGQEAYIEADIVSSKYVASHSASMYENILCFSDRPMLGESDYSNGIWRIASGGTGTREISDVKGSGFSKGFHITGETSMSGMIEVAVDEVPLEYGMTYVLSCYAKGYGKLHIEEGKTAWEGVSHDVTNKWKQYSLSFTVGEKDGATVGDSDVSVYFGVNGGVESDVLICGMKLERSDTGKASKWTANPDDSKRERKLPY